MLKNKPRTLIYDIETSPLISYTWGIWEQNVIEVKEEWHMLCFSYKWLGEKTTHSVSLPDFSLYKKDPKNDREVVKKLWELLDEADAVVGHNSDAFDNKKTYTRFAFHKLPPPSPFKKIDTKKIAKRYFKFDSNKLDNLGKFLGLGEKVNTGGFDLWLGCMAGDMKSWNKMTKYCNQDVALDEKLYLRLRPYMDNHPNLNVLNGDNTSCPNCGSHAIQKRGFGINSKSKYQRLQCQLCSCWFKGENIKCIQKK